MAMPSRPGSSTTVSRCLFRYFFARVAAYLLQSYTLYGHMRPFGSSVLLASIDKTGPQLYMIEPSGLSYGYLGVAIGKGRLAAKTEIEKLKLSQMTCREAVDAIAKMYVPNILWPVPGC
jgi:20S proteasome subunit alpha 7